MAGHYRIALRGRRSYRAGVLHARGATEMAMDGARFVSSFRILEEKK